MKTSKESILLTSLELFATYGYDAVSVSQISTKLNITKGALYKHFINKQDIFDSIVKKMEENDFKESQKFLLPTDVINYSSNLTLKEKIENLISFALNQAEYWSKNEFASNFRKLLILEQYKNEKMSELYERYLHLGQLSYVEDLFEKWQIKDFKLKALQFFAPLSLFYSICDLKIKENFKNNLQLHFENFKNEVLKNEIYIK